MSKIRLDHGVVSFKRMSPYVPQRADINPAKRVTRLYQLIDSSLPNICVVRGEGIGDVIMLTPTLRAIREMFSNKIVLTVATNTKYLDGALVKVLTHNTDIDRIIDRDNLDESDFDLVINEHCPCIVHEKPMAPPINRIDLFARHAGVTLKDKKPRYVITRDEIQNGLNWFSNHGFNEKSKVLLVNLFSSAQLRCIDDFKIKETISDLALKHQIQSIIITHNSDKQTDIDWKLIPGTVILNNADIRQIASIMVHCNAVLCPDSAILHLAGALEVPTISIFTGTDPRARINYFPQAIALWGGDGMMGHPHWYDPCPHKDLCWKVITKDSIVDACVKHITNTKRVNLKALTIKPLETEVI